MEFIDKVRAIRFIRPNAEFVLTGDELNWVDKNQTKPTDAEIQAGWIAYEAAEESAEQARLTAKSNAQAKLTALGLTIEDLQALGL